MLHHGLQERTGGKCIDATSKMSLVAPGSTISGFVPSSCGWIKRFTTYRRKCENKTSSLLRSADGGGLSNTESPTIGAELIDSACRPSGILRLLDGDGKGNGIPAVGDASSNRSNTTILGSVRVRSSGMRAEVAEGRAKPLWCDARLVLRLLSVGVVDAYSGKSAKLSGVMTTPYVPGRFLSALRSLSSSVARA